MPDGCYGELVITSFSKEAVSPIRYKTGDVARIVKRKGLCGVWVERIASRSDDMLIIKGVDVFPSQIETALCNFSGLSSYYLLEIEKFGFSDHAILYVGLMSEKYNFEISQIHEISEKLRKSLKDDLGVHIDINIFSPGVLERFELKRELSMINVKLEANPCYLRSHLVAPAKPRFLPKG